MTLSVLNIQQVKIGMDLSRVVLPTFILEPKSMLEKVSDFLTHSEVRPYHITLHLISPKLLVATTRINDPLERMVGVVKWYLSGFYLKPKGVKKPYNPVLGELFRCSWNHPDSKSFFIGEQVSPSSPSPSHVKGISSPSRICLLRFEQKGRTHRQWIDPLSLQVCSP